MGEELLILVGLLLRQHPIESLNESLYMYIVLYTLDTMSANLLTML